MRNPLRLVFVLLLAIASAFAQWAPLVLVPTGPHHRCNFCQRDGRGRIRRSAGARAAFRASNPCPSTGVIAGACPGFEIDHVRPLRLGGADAPANMQWLSVEEHRVKTAAER